MRLFGLDEKFLAEDSEGKNVTTAHRRDLCGAQEVWQDVSHDGYAEVHEKVWNLPLST